MTTQGEIDRDPILQMHAFEPDLLSLRGQCPLLNCQCVNKIGLPCVVLTLSNPESFCSARSGAGRVIQLQSYYSMLVKRCLDLLKRDQSCVRIL